MRNRVAVDSQAFAQMSKAWVVSACGTVDEDMIRKLEVGPEAEKFLRNPDCCGGSVIVSPMSRVVAGPMGPEEGILYADCDLQVGVQAKLRHDFAGHYNRPDIFQLQVNRAAPRIYTVNTTPEQLPPVTTPALESAVSGRIAEKPRRTRKALPRARAAQRSGRRTRRDPRK